MTDQPATEVKTPPTLEEVLGTTDAAKQVQIVAELVSRLNRLTADTEVALTIFARPADGMVRVTAPLSLSIEAALTILDAARNTLLEKKVRMDLEAERAAAQA